MERKFKNGDHVRIVYQEGIYNGAQGKTGMVTYAGSASEQHVVRGLHVAVDFGYKNAVVLHFNANELELYENGLQKLRKILTKIPFPCYNKNKEEQNGKEEEKKPAKTFKDILQERQL